MGSADEEALAWLLVEQTQQLLYLAEVEEARRFWAAQWPHYNGPLRDTEDEQVRLLEGGWQEAALPWDWHDRLAETVRESRANYRLMAQWFDQ